MPLPKVTVCCAGECSQSFEVVEPRGKLARVAVALVVGADLTVNKGWEFDGKRWWCKHCRVRRRLLKPVA